MPFPATLSCWAVTAPGVEALTARELTRLGIVTGASEPGGVEFTATATQLATALLWIRTATRITVRMAEFRASSFAELEKHARRVPWSDLVAPGGAIHFRVTSKKSRLYHQDGIAERLERSVAAAVAGVTAVRAPSVAEELEDNVQTLPEVQRVIVRLFRDQVTLSADAAGALLYLRGWRQAVAKAPLRETLAATLLAASGWFDGEGPHGPLVDPFCGSGTIVIEAALMARRIAPGHARRFAAEAWPGLGSAQEREAIWTSVRAEAAAGVLPASPVSLVGFDRDSGAIDAARSNAVRAGVERDVTFARQSLSQLADDQGEGWLVTNPPYGARIGERTALRDLYATLGRAARERLPDWHLTMLSADRMLEVQLRLPLHEVLRTTNGGIPVRIVSS
ncbi:MAG: class I SAM-dependent RNA methyltransferase [Gemmatimonadota bacterium]